MRKAIDQYLDVKRAQGRADLTIVAYEKCLRLLLGDYLTRPVRSIQKRGDALYLAALKGRKADSHRNLLTAGRLWARFCVKQKWLKANPFADVEPIGQRVHGSEKSRLTTDEARRLEAWCVAHPRDQGAILTLGYLYLGTRNTELGMRSVRDLDDNCSVLRIGKAKSRAGQRSLRIPDALVEMLRAHVAGRSLDAPVFTDTYGKRLKSNAARSHAKRICALAGVTVVPPQALRRTWSSLAREAEVSALDVARHLGHGSVKVSQQSYIDRETERTTQTGVVLKALRGGP